MANNGENNVSAGTVVVRRRRSSHHRRHHHRHHSYGSSIAAAEANSRKVETLRAISYIIPSILAFVGVALWYFLNSYSDPSTRPSSLVSLSQWLIGLGVGVFILRIFSSAAKKMWSEYKAEAQTAESLRSDAYGEASEAEPDRDHTLRRRRSTHHIHHHRSEDKAPDPEGDNEG